MSISKLFQQLHGILDVDSLVPMINRRDIVKKKDFDEIVKYLEVDAKKIFFDPNNAINWCIYYDGLLYMPLHGMKMEILEMTHAKEMLHQQLNILQKTLQNKNFELLFRYIDKKILIPAFIKYYQDIPENQLYEIFIDLYQRTEYGFDKIPIEIVKKAFSVRQLSTEWHERIEELKKKVKNKEFVKIYRGETPQSTPNNMSWTLSKKVANFFATRFSSKGNILQKTVKVTDCLDYLTSRNEEEILYLQNGNN